MSARNQQALAAVAALFIALVGCGTGTSSDNKARRDTESQVTTPPRGVPLRADPGRRAVLLGIRKQTAFLHEDTALPQSLRRALSGKGQADDDVLLVKWSPGPESTFVGIVSTSENVLMDIKFRWDAQTATGSIITWQPAAIDGPDRVTQRDAAAELRRYAKEDRQARESRLDAVESRLGYQFSADYRAFMLAHDGFIGQARSQEFLDLTPIYDLVDANDSPLRAAHPGLILIGSDGGQRLIGYDTRTRPNRLVLLPGTSHGWDDTIIQATSFEEFLKMVDETGFRP